VTFRNGTAVDKHLSPGLGLVGTPHYSFYTTYYRHYLLLLHSTSAYLLVCITLRTGVLQRLFGRREHCEQPYRWRCRRQLGAGTAFVLHALTDVPLPYAHRHFRQMRYTACWSVGWYFFCRMCCGWLRQQTAGRTGRRDRRVRYRPPGRTVGPRCSCYLLAFRLPPACISCHVLSAFSRYACSTT